MTMISPTQIDLGKVLCDQRLVRFIRRYDTNLYSYITNLFGSWTSSTTKFKQLQPAQQKRPEQNATAILPGSQLEFSSGLRKLSTRPINDNINTHSYWNLINYRYCSLFMLSFQSSINKSVKSFKLFGCLFFGVFSIRNRFFTYYRKQFFCIS